MATVIVITDFSETAHNALEYACAFSAASTKMKLLLVNISAVPASYSGDGVAMAAISDSLQNKTGKLEEEIASVTTDTNRPAIQFKALLGDFIETLQELIEEEQAGMVIMGTPAAYGDIWAWDTDTLNALTKLAVPVLTVPRAVGFKPIANISFVSIPGNLHGNSPIGSIKKLVRYTGARLHVVMVITPQHNETKDKEAEAVLRNQLEEVSPEYHTINDPHIVQAIGRFVEEQRIDLLVVRPRKHGIWYNLFHKSYAKELAKLNLIPVMALHDEWAVD
jgi:nucleotide-binding universal stress UspA family protein